MGKSLVYMRVDHQGEEIQTRFHHSEAELARELSQGMKINHLCNSASVGSRGNVVETHRILSTPGIVC